MFMLVPSKVVKNCFTMGVLDAATGGSTTQMMVNIWESASILDSWETALPKAKTVLARFDQQVDDTEAEENVKHFYQTMRHGMSFDWVLNHMCAKILAMFPYSRVFEFGYTAEFVNGFADDEVFTSELAEADAELEKVFDWVFENYPDRYVYQRLAKVNSAKVESALYNISVDPSLGDGLPYVIPTATAHRVNYLSLLMELFALGVGWANRSYWDDYMEQIRKGESEGVIVVGNKFEAFLYGNLGEGVKWTRMENGIKMLGISTRQQRSDYVRAFPDEMTFFRVSNSTLYVDETLFPQVSFDNGKTWIDGNMFKENASVSVDTPMKMKIRFPFEPMYDDIGKKVIKVSGSTNCVIKDATVTLDENNEAETQILFRGKSVSFKIIDSDKKYPFSFFTSSTVALDTLSWLE